MQDDPSNKFTVFQWTKFTFLGWVTGVVLILLLSAALHALGTEHKQFYLGFGMGAGVGWLQWLSLKKYRPVSKNWIWFSAAGMGIPFIFFDLLPTGTVAHEISWSIVTGSLLMGLMQYSMLRKHSHKAYLWLPGNLLAWILAVITVFTIDFTMHLQYVMKMNLLLAGINLLLILDGGIVLGLISGLTLRKIFS